MDEEIKQKWIKALRSGDYRQGQHCLRNGDNFCCLGVLADVLGARWTDAADDEYENIHTYEGGRFAILDGRKAEECLPSEVALRLGLDGKQERLWEMNDTEDASFSEIADYIEQNL
jgi:hypothetical protein